MERMSVKTNQGRREKHCAIEGQEKPIIGIKQQQQTTKRSRVRNGGEKNTQTTFMQIGFIYTQLAYKWLNSWYSLSEL